MMMMMMILALSIWIAVAVGDENDCESATTAAATCSSSTETSQVDDDDSSSTTSSSSSSTTSLPKQDDHGNNHDGWKTDDETIISRNHQHDFSSLLHQVALPLDDHISLQVLQQSKQFTSSAQHAVEHDITGTVVWGASICLARYLLLEEEEKEDFWERHDNQENDESSRIEASHDVISMELGCGMGLPSLALAASRKRRRINDTENHNTTTTTSCTNNTTTTTTTMPNIRILATDMEASTLQQLDQVAQLNHINKPSASTDDGDDELELFQLDWKDSFDRDDDDDNHQTPTLPRANVIIGADIIYQDTMVDPLVQTIQKYLQPHDKARVYLALRPTRAGVRRLVDEAMPRAGLELMDVISCRPYLWEKEDGDTETNSATTTNNNNQNDDNQKQEEENYYPRKLRLPPELIRDESHLHRFQGNDAVYVFRRKVEEQT